jgi:hypothetical protein
MIRFSMTSVPAPYLNIKIAESRFTIKPPAVPRKVARQACRKPATPQHVCRLVRFRALGSRSLDDFEEKLFDFV